MIIVALVSDDVMMSLPRTSGTPMRLKYPGVMTLICNETGSAAPAVEPRSSDRTLSVATPSGSGSGRTDVTPAV